MINAFAVLIAQGFGKEENITIIRVPGAIEIPVVAEALAKKGGYAGIICLGCVIRGATYHFEVVANECSKGITHVSLKYAVPVANGVLTTNTIDEAVQRAGSKAGNKGCEAASSALEMANVMSAI